MNIKNKSRRQKIFYALGVAGLLILLVFVSRIESRQFSTELLFETDAIETIKNEVAVVRSTREDYFTMIGYGNGGVYDQFQLDLTCVEDLDERSIFLKNLRNDFKRMILVADFRLTEQQINSRERAVEALMARVFGDETSAMLDKTVAEIGLDEKTKTKLDEIEAEIEKIMQEILPEEELEALKKEETEKRINFQQATEKFKNCAQIYKKVEDCTGELSAWFTARSGYEALILRLENLHDEKQQMIVELLTPVEKEINQFIYADLNSN